MRDIHNLTRVLISCWELGGTEKESIPAGQGLLDKALKKAVERGAFPDWVRKQLQFSETRIGFRCIQLPEILRRAQQDALVTAPNPSYHRTEVEISRSAAQELARRAGITLDDATAWGKMLREAVEATKKDFADWKTSHQA